MKEFFIGHTEKLVLGLCAALAGWFVYSSIFGMPRYDKTPATFSEAVDRARQTVTNSPPKLDDLPALDFEKDLQQLRAAVDLSKYPLPTSFIRPLELNYQFRGTPAVLQPKAPIVRINRGLILTQEGRDPKEKGDVRTFKKLLGEGLPAELIWFLGNEKMAELLDIVKKEKTTAKPAATAPKPGEKPRRDAKPAANKERRRAPRGAIWAEVVAPFPHADQIREFIRVLKEGRTKAGVRYALAEIERREMVESRQWSPWKRIAWEKQFDLFDAADKLDDPFQTLPNLVVVPGLVMRVPEPARDAGDKGAKIQTNRSNIPEIFEGAKAVKWTPAEENPKAPADAAARPVVPEEENADNPDQPADEDQPKTTVASIGTTFNSFSDVDTAMIRVFDFTIEPNKRYQYRVRAVLFNPNFDRPDVVDPAESLKTFLAGEFSEPSEEIYVEPSTSLFLADTKAGPGRVDFEIYHWFAESGRWVRQVVPYYVGQIVGTGALKPVKVPVYNPKDGKITVEEKPIEKGFDTNLLLLHVNTEQVSDNLPTFGEFNVRPPREVLLVNEFGDLIRRREYEDQINEERVGRSQAIESSIKDKGAGGRRDASSRDEDSTGEPEDLDNPVR
jgi:hypothetical protein